jgi:hypothetical protein
MHLLETPGQETESVFSPEGLPAEALAKVGRKFMIQSPSPASVAVATSSWRRPDWIIRTFSQRSLRLRGEPGLGSPGPSVHALVSLFFPWLSRMPPQPGR